MGHAVDGIGAKRVVLDTVETLFSGLSNTGVLRAELRRLFRWLKDKGVTAVITGERGEGQLTRQGLEEYVSDCVILLDHRVIDQVSTRRVRIVKYRGTTHGTKAGAAAGNNASFGLFSIRERMKVLGGMFFIASARGRGTLITLELPLAAKTVSDRHPLVQLPT